MVNDISFGKLIYKLRKKRNISLEVLSEGVCDFSRLGKVEKGKVELDKLVRDRLLGRLGVESENYESFLFYKEYHSWRERQEIVYCILYGKIEEARQRLENYQSKENRLLDYQFYLTMFAQIRRIEGAEKEELRELFQKAVVLTVSEPLKRKLKGRILSVEELNLLLECAFYQEEISLEWYKELISYIEQMPLDNIALSKIYPKTIYYFYETWISKGEMEQQEYFNMLKFCNRAIGILQKAKRMFYLWELLEAKIQILQYLIPKKPLPEIFQRWYQTCKDWKEVLEEIYAEYGVSKEMQEFCYIYVDMEAHCIGDVIKIRRKMLGMTAEQLSEGICSERTINRLENNKRETKRETIFQLFERLHMSMEFCKNDLLTEHPEAKRLFGELKQANNRMECEKVDQLLEEVKSMVSLDIPENRQAIKRNEIINECNKKRKNRENLDKQHYINRIKEALGYTIPYEVAVASGNKYLTQNELSCLQNMMNRMDWTHPELEQCVQTLYNLFEHQRRIGDCLNMYEFVMGAVASHLGNRGDYDLSDEIERKILKNTIVNRRLGVIDDAMYGLLWNDVQRKKEQHLEKQDVVVKKELQKCKCLCEMCKDTLGIAFFEKKLKDGM